jgi:hypothetical protein
MNYLWNGKRFDDCIVLSHPTSVDILIDSFMPSFPNAAGRTGTGSHLRRSEDGCNYEAGENRPLSVA